MNFSPLFLLAILSIAMMCSARSVGKSTIVTKNDEAEERDMSQHMIFPYSNEDDLRARFGNSEYVWDTKGFPRKVEDEITNTKQEIEEKKKKAKTS
ncbi:hypothetical protein C0J52_25485 [Blattella germanica]|nr:hypothetical protein C0J52_25485 [Blattella germanica]